MSDTFSLTYIYQFSSPFSYSLTLPPFICNLCAMIFMTPTPYCDYEINLLQKKNS